MKPKGKNGIPWVRDRIAEIATDLRRLEHADAADRLLSLLPHMIRNTKVAPRAKAPVSTRMTPELAAKCRSLKRDNPDLTSSQIADALNINGGRVSEALHGLR